MSKQGRLFTALVAWGVLLTAGIAWAQQGNFNTGAGGAGMSRNTGAGSASTLSAAQGYGLDSRFTGSGFNRYTTGSSAMGTVTAGDRAGSAGFGQTGTATGFGGTGSTRTGNFGGMGNMGRMGGMMGGMMGGRNMFGMNQQTGMNNQKSIRTRTVLGFASPVAVAGASVGTGYQKVIDRVLQRGDYGAGQVSLTMEGQVAVLSGTVESDHARDIAERLALLEPGIAAVRNELIVRAPEPTRAP